MVWPQVTWLVLPKVLTPRNVASPPPSGGQPPFPGPHIFTAMTTYEYQVTRMDGDREVQRGNLNLFGEQGWCLIAVQGAMAYLRREVELKPVAVASPTPPAEVTAISSLPMQPKAPERQETAFPEPSVAAPQPKKIVPSIRRR